MRDYSSVKSERHKLPASESVHVERLQNDTNDAFIFVSAHRVSSSKTTFIYLTEIPANLDFSKMSMTFLGQGPHLSADPVQISPRRFLLISDLEPSEIVEIQVEKTGNPKRPFLSQVHSFQNFGLIQQIDIDKPRNQIVVSSYRPENNLQTFQKGLLLDSLSMQKFDTSCLTSFKKISNSPLSFIASTRSKSTIYHLGNSHTFFVDPQISFNSPVLSIALPQPDTYIVVQELTLSVLKTRKSLQRILDYPFALDNPVLSSSICDRTVLCSHLSTLTFLRLSSSLSTVSTVIEIETEDEVKLVESGRGLFFVVYWILDRMDIYNTEGKCMERVELGGECVNSVLSMAGQEETGEGLVVTGTIDGKVSVRKVGKGEASPALHVQVGRRPVAVREAGKGRVAAISDECAMIEVSLDMRAAEVEPMCHSDLLDLVRFSHEGADYYLSIQKDLIGFCRAERPGSDNHRQKEMRLAGKKQADRFSIIGETIVTFTSDTERNESEVNLFDVASGRLESNVPLPEALVECMTPVRFQEQDFVCVGMSVPRGRDQRDRGADLETAGGRLALFGVKNGELWEAGELAFEKPVRAVQLLEGGACLLVLLGTSLLKVFKLETKAKKTAERAENGSPAMKELLQHRLPFLVDTLSVKENYVLATDFYWMANVLQFENSRFPRFKSVGRLSAVNNEIIGAEILSPTSFVVSDAAGNILVYSLAETGSCETDFIEFADRNAICLGEKVVAFRRGCRTFGLQFSDPIVSELTSQSLQFVLMGGCCGGVYAMYEIPRKTFCLLDDLCTAVTGVKEANSKYLRRKDFRRPIVKNRKMRQAGGIVDGDVLAALLEMGDKKVHDIMTKMSHVNKPSVDTIRDLIRFFEASPVS